MTNSAFPHEDNIPRAQAYTAPDSALSSTQLEQRLLHKLLVSVNAPADWPGWLLGGVALLPIAGVAGLWWFLVGPTAAVRLAFVLALFTLVDALMLVTLLYLRLSFGPVGPQLFSLELPRLMVAMLVVPVAAWLGPVPALVGVVIVNLGASLALAWGAFLEPQRLGLSRVSLIVDSLPHDMPPVRLLHISDLHVERFGRREEKILRMVRAVAPDLVVLTGDYLNLSCVDDPVAHADARRVLAELGALSADEDGHIRGGVYAVLGSPPVDRNSASLFEGLPIRLLRDESVAVDLPAPAGLPPSPSSPLDQGGRPAFPIRPAPLRRRRLALIGLDCSHNLERDAERLAMVAAQAPSGVFRVLLYHSPELIPVAPKLDINLYLCGHTHGGQVRLPFFGALLTSSRLGKQFEMGHYQSEGTHLYVSRGVGLEGMGAPRVRFLCPPEIALFSLSGNRD